MESLESLQAAGRDVSADHSLFCSEYSPDPAERVRAREHREIVTTLLTLHAQASARDADSAWAIGLRWWSELPVQDIARMRGSTERDVFRLFAGDYQKLRGLLTDQFGVGALRHV
jgi:hypothetical protein